MAASLKVFDGPPEDFDKYDICLEFPVDSSTNKLKAVGSEVLDRMISIFGSKYVFLFYSDDTSKIYALIRAALKLVKIKAETDGYKLLLDADVAKERAFDGDEEARVDGFSIPHVEEVSKIEPFEYIYGEYVSDINVQDLYHKAEGSTHPFPKLVRIKLMSRMLRTTKALTKDCELSLDYLQLGSVIHDYYPVHDRDQLDTLRGDWLSVCFVPWRQPFLDIKDYFGEKMGFYFLFLGYLSYWFLAPVLIGIAFQVLAIYYDNYNRPELPAFAFFIAVWALSMARYWKKVQQITAMKWNTIGVSQHIAEREEVRYDYYGTEVKSSIDGQDTLYFRASKRSGYYCVSGILILCTMGLCLGSVTALFYVRSLVRAEDSVTDYDQWILPAMLSVQITIANRAIYIIAAALTRMENHRLDEDFDYALTIKLFFMQFVNASSSFYYLAFAAPYIPNKDGDGWNRLGRTVRGCGPEDCVTTLAVHVLVIVSTQILGSVAVYYWIPYVARIIYNFKCDVYAWWLAFYTLMSDCYATYTECCTFILTSSIAQCCLRCYDCCYNCCCGAPLPAPVPLVRTNIGEGIDRSRGRAAVMDRSTNPQSDAEDGRNQVTTTEYDDDISDLDADEQTRMEESKNGEEKSRDPRSPPPPLKSLAELRIGLTATHQQQSGQMNRALTQTYASHLESTLGIEEEGHEAKEDDSKFPDTPDAVFVRHYKFDQDHQLRRSYARVFLIIALVLCFGVLLPGSFLAVALLFRFEVRGKAWQLLMIYKRTFPFEVEDIGECWNRVFHGIATITVLTNAALISFTMKQFSEWSWDHRLCLFIGIVLGCRVFKAFLNGRLDEVPSEVIVQQKRAKFISDKLIRKIPDSKDDFAIDIL